MSPEASGAWSSLGAYSGRLSHANLSQLALLYAFRGQSHARNHLMVPFTLAPETPARRSCHRDKSDHVTPFPSSFQFGPSNVPVRTAFLQHSTQVLPKLFDSLWQWHIHCATPRD